jgi:hypothetical protein
MMTAAAGRDRMRTSLREISAFLGGRHDLSGFVAWGDALGAPVTFSLTTRAAGVGVERWTEIEVKLPARYPLILHVRRRQPFDGERIARGELVHVELGDRGFDHAFLVEAAPGEVIRHLLDSKVRAYLRAHQVVLATEMAEGAVLKVHVRGWLDELETARPAIELAVELAIGVREAYARVEEESPLGMGGSPFRPEPDAALTRRAAADREAEVRYLEQLKRNRSRGS